MSDQPYTTADLIAEAARQHAGLIEDVEFMGVGERMQGSEVCPGGGVTWDEFSTETFDVAQDQIHDLINGAADVSAWAVQLGVDGLQPEDHTLSVDGDGKPLVRLHCAFHPDLDDAARTAFVAGLARVLANGL